MNRGIFITIAILISIISTAWAQPMSLVQPEPPPVDESGVEYHVKTTMRKGFEIFYDRMRMTATFLEIAEDVRCPYDTECEDPGYALVEFKFSVEGEETDVITLKFVPGLDDSEQEVLNLDQYRISVYDVFPPQRENKTIIKAKYLVDLLVIKEGHEIRGAYDYDAIMKAMQKEAEETGGTAYPMDSDAARQIMREKKSEVFIYYEEDR